jgi:serine/threonine-protein kinase
MTAPSSSLVPIGTLIDGKFRITKEIGRGGMAVVFEALNVDIGKRVAVKILSQELVHSKTVMERFIREARAAARIRSPFICDVFDFGTYEDLPFIVMELLEGESLYDRLVRERKLGILDTLRIAEQIASGLSKAHDENIVHRDLKPENIFLTAGTEGETVAKIVDFGLARFYEPELEGGPRARLTKAGALFGTPAYMSPEQAQAQTEVDGRADLWALACIVYEMLIGRTVWNADQGVAMILAQIAAAPTPEPSRARGDLPKAFDAWFARALNRDLNQRFQSAREWMRALRLAFDPNASSNSEIELGRGTESRASPAPGLLEPIPPSAGTKPVVLTSDPDLRTGRSRTALIASLVLVTSGVVVVTTWRATRPPPPPQTAPVHALPQVTFEKPEAVARPPAEQDPYAVKLSEAQQALADGKVDLAKATFEAAFEQGQEKVARSLITHVSVALEEAGGPCRMRGIGHPRPYDATTASSQPSIALTSEGLVAMWSDNHEDEQRRHTYTTLLDPALRRVQVASSATPEARSIRASVLASGSGKLGLLYWDHAGDEPGIYARALSPDGGIAGAPQLLSKPLRGSHCDPDLTADDDGTFWAVWTEATDPAQQDLFLQHLSSELKPLGQKTRLTADVINLQQQVEFGAASIVAKEGRVNVAFRLQKGNQFALALLRVNPQEPSFGQGVQPIEAGRGAGLDSSADTARFVGSLIPVADEVAKHTEPQITCISDGCYVSWDDESGSHLGYVRTSTNELVWKRDLSAKGARPGLASRGDDAVVAWYEDGRVKIAKLSRDGAGTASVVARIKGFVSSPEIYPGQDTGPAAAGHPWYVAFRDYEAAEQEPFVARMDCE